MNLRFIFNPVGWFLDLTARPFSPDENLFGEKYVDFNGPR